MTTPGRPIAADEDPVCGMHVDPETARAKGLAVTHDGHEYVFCGKGCMLEFRDDPNTYLDPRHLPMM
ncbi:MAG: YHS domain-containing protein [Chloroflexi bacterium]|nr:YHS domain-containing protein [Chloroflexota bacterium]